VCAGTQVHYEQTVREEDAASVYGYTGTHHLQLSPLDSSEPTQLAPLSTGPRRLLKSS